ncbi:hypothetical protein [Phenylobacterium sp.]|uniref:hypothetical protein n=1 Tax=Phenylobacterium sp. TaxID=1871053 RepID=UPI002F40800D
MTPVRVFTPPNRLAKVLIETGGRTADEAAATAGAHIEELGPSLRRAVDIQVLRLIELHRTGEPALSWRAPELSDAAMQLAEIAGAAGRSDLGEVARGVLAMIGHQTGGPRADVIDLHLSALALLHGGSGAAGQASDVILRRLQDLRAAIGVSE